MRQIFVSGHRGCDVEQSGRLEWLLTNGLGGFSSGTVAGVNTRRYHGLLIAAPGGPDRFLLMSQLHEEILIGGKKWHLGAFRYRDCVHPRGHELLLRFTLYPVPQWIFFGGSWVLQKRIGMVHGQNTTVVHYRLLAASTRLEMLLRPFVAVRHYHALQRRDAAHLSVEPGANWHCVKSSQAGPHVWLASSAAFAPDSVWYNNVVYPMETARGLDDEEDLLVPGEFRQHLDVDDEVWFVATTEPEGVSWASLGQVFERTERRRRALLHQAGDPQGVEANLVVAADAFIIRNQGSTSVIAGYPWFTDWGRDAMISLPGLFLATGRASEALEVLTTFAQAERDGLIPNRFPDRSEIPEYNTVDAPLWFIYACYKYLRYTGDSDGLKPLWPVIKRIINGYRRGCAFGIGVDERGLVHAGARGVQLTWMDAKVGDWVVTPRQGYPVEITALWYNALCCAAHMGSQWDEAFSARCLEWAEETATHFRHAFWLADRGYLADVIGRDGTVDSGLRPNQLLALSLPYSLCSGKMARAIVNAVLQDLYTPVGLRSLSPRDPAFAATYGGDQMSRDGAYHQGTVWAWLMGPFVSAYRRAFGRTSATEQAARRMIGPLLDQLSEAGLGHISEIYDAQSPYTPRGCFAQAWSVAELLRLWVEEFGRQPLEMEV